MQILLTGATGFLGRHIAVNLITRGHRVRALVRREVTDLAAIGVEQRHGNISAFEDTCAAASGCDAIVHSAGCVDPLASIEQYHEANVRSTDCLLGACELLGIPRLLLTSCASVVLSNEDVEGADETRAYPTRWNSAYAHTKAMAEQRVLAANSSTLATCVLRPHLLWGTGERYFIPSLLDLARRGKLRLFGEPDRHIDPCHVENAADAHTLAVERLEIGSTIAGKTYFISQGEPQRIEGFVNALLRSGGFPVEQRRHSALAAKALATAARRSENEPTPLLNPLMLDLFNYASWFDLSAARRDLGYAPKLSSNEGMSRLFTALTRERMQTRKT